MSNEAKTLRVEANELQRRAQELRDKADLVERNEQAVPGVSLEMRIYSQMALPARTASGYHPDEYNGTTLSREVLDARDARNPPQLVLERSAALTLAGALQKLRRAYETSASPVGQRAVSVSDLRAILEDFNKVKL